MLSLKRQQPTHVKKSLKIYLSNEWLNEHSSNRTERVQKIQPKTKTQEPPLMVFYLREVIKKGSTILGDPMSVSERKHQPKGQTDIHISSHLIFSVTFAQTARWMFGQHEIWYKTIYPTWHLTEPLISVRASYLKMPLTKKWFMEPRWQATALLNLSWLT